MPLHHMLFACVAHCEKVSQEGWMGCLLRILNENEANRTNMIYFIRHETRNELEQPLLFQDIFILF